MLQLPTRIIQEARSIQTSQMSIFARIKTALVCSKDMAAIAGCILRHGEMLSLKNSRTTRRSEAFWSSDSNCATLDTTLTLERGRLEAAVAIVIRLFQNGPSQNGSVQKNNTDSHCDCDFRDENAEVRAWEQELDRSGFTPLDQQGAW